MAERDWAHERVLRFLSETSGQSPDSIALDKPLANFDIDSLEAVDFIMGIEDETGLEIPDPLRPLITVDDLITLVRSAQA